MTHPLRPSLRLLAFVPTIIAIGAVVYDFIQVEFFGSFLLPVVSLLVYVGVGLLLVLRLPRHPVGWLLLAAGTFFQLSLAASAYSWAEFTRAPGTPLVLVGYAWIPALGCLFMAIALFPTGRPPSPRWHWPLALMVMTNALTLLASLVTPEFQIPQPLSGQGTPHTVVAANPLAIDGTLGTLLGYVYSSQLSFLVYLIPAVAILVRFRTAAGNEREQLKWFAYTSSFAVVFFVVPGIVPLFSYLAGLGPLLAIVAIDLIPISVAIAILRFRLYDIDVLIERTLVYAALSASLAATYWLFVIFLQGLLRPITGGGELAVAGSTLATLALVQPLRARIQGAVDRRFYRGHYDAARAVDAFSVRLRDKVALESVRGDLIDAVGQTVQPTTASLWLRDRA